MDKHEYKHLMDEIQYLIDQQEYARAAEIADNIDWRRVRSIMTLGTISDLYRINKRYEDARDIMLMAYDRKPENSQVCYSLCELFIKTGEMADAVEFYKEYERLSSPEDPGRYILQYKMYEANNVSLEERAEVLENLRQRERQEKWLYELAYLYHRMELEIKCVEVCDELILWFGSGEYVNKALELKRLHAPLTPEQQAKYDSRFEPEEEAEPEEEMEIEPEDGLEDHVWEGGQDTGEIFDESGEMVSTDDPTRVFDAEEVRRQTGEYAAEGDTAPMVKIMDMGQYNTLNLQAEIAAGVNEVLSGTVSAAGDFQQPVIDPETGYYDIGSTTEILDSLSQNTASMEAPEVYFGETGEILQNTGEVLASQSGLGEEYAGEDMYAEGYDLYEQTAGDGVSAESGGEAAAEGYTDEEDLRNEQGNGVSEYPEEGYYGEDIPWDEGGAAEYPVEEGSDFQEDQDAAPVSVGTTAREEAYEDSYAGYVEEDIPMEEMEASGISIADRVMEQMRLESLEAQKKLENEALTAQPPEPMARALTQEPDGQISLVVPEGRKLEKQITGQLSIEDIRAEWERMKKESREKQEEEVRQRVQRQTGKMFTEFEEALRDNILKQMESKEDPSLYDLPETTVESENQADTAAEGDWAVDEWMQEGVEDTLAEPEEPYGEETAGEHEEPYGEETTEEYEEPYGEETTEEYEEPYGEETAGEYEEPYGEETAGEHEEPYGEETAGEYEEPYGEETAGEHEEPYGEETAGEYEEPYGEETTEEYEESYAEETAGESGNQADTAAEGDWAVDEWMQEGAEDTLAESEEFYGEEMTETTAEPEETPEEPEGASMEPEEMPEEPEGASMETEETPEEPEGASIETEETPEESEESPAESEETVEESSEGSGDFWEDDEYPDFDAIEPEEKEKPEALVGHDSPEKGEEEPAANGGAQKGSEGKETSGQQKPEAPAVRSLTEEEENLFGEMVQGRSAREQLVKAIDNISMAAYAGNLVITGEESSQAVEMAKNMVREVKQTDSNFSGKAAKISGGKLNGKNVSEFLEQLKNGALIVDNASQLSSETLADLYKCMQQDSYGLLVILIDTRKKMNLFLKEHKKFAPMFSARVDLQPLSNDVLAEYAQQYAREREFSIDDLGMLALHTRIDEMQTAKHSVTKAEIGEVMDAAIESAMRKNVGHFFDILFGRRYDDEDMIIITEKDFE